MRFNPQLNGRIHRPVNALPCLCMVLALPLGATDYCVSNSGSDAASGIAPSNCWQTCGKVESFDGATGFSGGDTISFTRSQTFTSCDLDLDSDGTSGSRITIQATGTGAAPVLRGSSGGTVIDLGGGDWWTIKDVRVSGNNYAADTGIIAGTRTTIDNVEVDRNRCYGIRINNGEHNVTITNSDIHNNAGQSSCGTLVGGIYMSPGSVGQSINDLTITNNQIHDNEGPGGSEPIGIVLGSSSNGNPTFNNLRIEGNSIDGNGDFTQAVQGRGMSGHLCGSGIVIRNNIIRNNSARGMRFGHGGSTAPGCSLNATIDHNLFYHNNISHTLFKTFSGTINAYNNHFITVGTEPRPASGILVQDGGGTVNAVNNLMHFDPGGRQIEFVNSDQADWGTINYNLYYWTGTGPQPQFGGGTNYASHQGRGFDANGIHGSNPNFVDYNGTDNAPGYVAHDFNLDAAAPSPAIDAGTIISGITDNFKGTAPDMGALESGGGAQTGDGNDQTCVDQNCVWTHNVGSGPNRALYVMTASEGVDRNVDAVSSDAGGAFTKIVDHDANSCTAEIWRLNGPTSGAHQLTVDWNGAAADVHASVSSVDLSGMQQVAADATASGSAASSTLLSINITPTADNAEILQAVCGTTNVTFTHGSGQSELFDAPDDSNEMTGTGSRKTLPTAALTSMSATASSSTNLTGVTAAFKPTTQDPGQVTFWLRDDGNDSLPCDTYANGCLTFAHIESLGPFSPGDQILLACDDTFRQQWSWITGDEGAGVAGNRIRIAKGDTGSCTANPKISGADVLAGWDPPIAGAYTKSCLVEPGMMYDNGIELTRGSFGSLNEDEWDHNAGSCYLRLAGDVDPDGGGHVIEAAVRNYGLQFNHGGVGGIRITDLDIEKVKDIGVVTHIGNDFIVERVSVNGAGRECFRSQSLGTDTKGHIYEDLTASNCNRRDTAGQLMAFQFTQSGTSTGGHEGAILRGTSPGAFFIAGNDVLGDSDQAACIEIKSEFAGGLIDQVQFSGCRTGIRMTGPDGTASAGEAGDGWTITRSDITAVGDCLLYEGLNAPNGVTSYNILRDCGNRGVDTRGSTNIGTLAHNVVYSPTSSCFLLSDQNGAVTNPTAILKNNILLDCGDHAVEAPAGLTNFVSDRNGYFNPTNSFFSRGVGPTDETLVQWQSSTSKDANSTDQDPKFVNAVGQDFRLLPASPCRDRGEVINGVTVKVDNVLPDCGKEEYLAAPGLLGPR